MYLSTASGNSRESRERISSRESPVCWVGRQHVRSNRLLKLVQLNGLIGSVPNPGVRDLALAVPLEVVHQLAQATAKQPT